MPALLLSALSMLGGGISSIFGYLGDVASSAFQAVTQFHQEGISAARDLGLGVQQAQAYTQALTRSTAELAVKYGVTADAIKEIQRGISDATGRQLLLNEAETEGFLIMNKLVGAQTTNAFTSEIMNKMGGQVSAVQGAISKAYATAAKQGLNASKFSGEVAKNLTLANKLSFKDGINGIIKMTALSQKLGFNLQSIEQAASKFMDFDSAIESSAQLNMLGGAAGAYGSNPLEMMYEANYNPEAFTERMTKMIDGLGEFDKKSGMGRVSGMNMDFARNIAKAMGISADEVVSMAKKSAEVKFKESRFGDALTRRFGNDEEKKNYILNNSTYNTTTKQLELNGKAVSDLTDADLASMMQFDGMSDHELMQKQAEALTSLPEKMSGAAASISAEFAESINRFFPNAVKGIEEITNIIRPHAKIWGENIGNHLGNIFAWLKDHKDPLKRVLEGVLTIVDFLTSKWYLLLAGLFLSSGLGRDLLSKTPKLAKGGWKLGKSLFADSKTRFGDVKAGYQLHREAGFSRMSSLTKGVKLAGPVSKLAKTTGALSVAVGALQAGSAIYDYSENKKELDNQLQQGAISKKEYDAEVRNAQDDRNEQIGGAVGAVAGAAIGTAIAGPLGTVIGGVIGDFVGGYIGKNFNNIFDWFSEEGNWLADAILAVVAPFTLVIKYWDEIGDFVSDTWNGAMSAVNDVFGTIGEIWDTTIGAVGQAFDNWIEWWSGNIEGVIGFIGDAWDGAVSTVSSWGKSITSWWNSSGKAIFNRILDIFMPIRVIIRNWDNITNFVGEAWNTTIDTITSTWNTYVAEPFNGFIDNIVGRWNGIMDAWNNFSLADTVRDVFGFLQGAFNEYIARPIQTAWNTYVAGPLGNVAQFIIDAWNTYVAGPFGAVVKFIQDTWNNTVGAIQRFIDDPIGTARAAASSALERVGFSNGGIVGGDSYDGDKVVAAVNSGEMILNRSQQSDLFGLINNIPSLLTRTSVVGNVSHYGVVNAKPFGDNMFDGLKQLMKNIGNAVTNGGQMDIAVKDININISGTIKLDGGNGHSTSIDARQLLSDASFVSALKDLLKQSISNDINGGRIMNDTATMRGLMPSMSLIGRT